MSTDSLRWKITRAVRRRLLASKPDGWVRRLYSTGRTLPFVRTLWRTIDRGGTSDWLDAHTYARRRGPFAEGKGSADTFVPPPADADSEEFFSDLIHRILTNEPRIEPIEGRIVIVNNGLSAGGAERQIKYTLVGLAKRGKDIRFLGEYLGLAAGLDFHLAEVQAANVEARAPRQVARPLNEIFAGVSQRTAEGLSKLPPDMLVEILAMVDELREIRPSVVHLWQDETSIKHSLSALIAGVPRIILSGRNLNPTYFAFHRPMMRGAYRALAKTAGVVLSNNSHAGAASYGAWLGIDSKHITVIHNGVDASRWPSHDDSEVQAWRQAYASGAGEPIILGAFRLSPEKRPLLWVKVAALARAARLDLRFIIAGDGPMRAEVEAEVRRLRLEKSVHLLGEIPDISIAMTSADAFMLLSAQEGIPNVLLEAQWYGVPCLVTDAGGIREAICDGVTGTLSSSDDANVLARSLIELLDNEKLRSSARTEGPRLLVDRFGVQRMLDETCRLYQLT